MTSEQWQHVKDLLVQALELAPEKRSAFLDRTCEGDHALRAEIDALLSEGDLVGANFLQSLPGLGDFAGLGDGADMAFAASGMFGWHQAEVGHEVGCGRKA